MPIMRHIMCCVLFATVTLASFPGATYRLESKAFVRRNGDRVNNRPLYCHHMPVVALAGDRPMVRLVNKHFVLGQFMLAVERSDSCKWLHDFSEIVSRYRCNTVEWELSDAHFPGLLLRVVVTPLAREPGYALKLTVVIDEKEKLRRGSGVDVDRPPLLVDDISRSFRRRDAENPCARLGHTRPPEP